MEKKGIVLFLFLICISACIPHRELILLNEGREFSPSAESIGQIPALKIQIDDVINISVRTTDMRASAAYNLPLVVFDGSLNNGGNIGITDFLVDNQGYIDYPGIGRMMIAGMTLIELKNKLLEIFNTLLVDPVVIVRFTNFKFTVLGAVGAPATYTVSEDRLTLFEAIGMAGDFDRLANLENILIIREQNGEREFGRVNVHDRNIFTSPYFYLRQNDVIYVEPRPEITLSDRNQLSRVLPWLSVITSLTTLVLTLSRL